MQAFQCFLVRYHLFIFNNQNHLLFQHFGSIADDDVTVLMWSFAALLNFITNNLIISTGYGMFIKRRYMKAKAVAICCSCFEETHYLPEQIAKVSPWRVPRYISEIRIWNTNFLDVGRTLFTWNQLSITRMRKIISQSEFKIS